MAIEPQKEHQWLMRLLGDWTFEAEAVMEPGRPPQRVRGTEKVRLLGGLWVIAEGVMEFPGGDNSESVMILGYDPQKMKFVGMYTGSMMTNLFVYEGELDAAEKTLALDTEGPSMLAEGQTMKYRDAIEVDSDHERITRSSGLADDGHRHEFMVTEYRRVR